jgi:hypothetical protein
MLRDARSKRRATRIVCPKHVLMRVTEEALSAKAGSGDFRDRAMSFTVERRASSPVQPGGDARLSTNRHHAVAALCARSRAYSFWRESKKLVEILRSSRADLFRGQAAQFADLTGNLGGKRRLVALAAMRNRRQVG